MKRTGHAIVLMVLFSLFVSACVAPGSTSAPADTTDSSAAEPAEVQDFVTWYQYDQNNEDTASDERVGNTYIRETIPLFNEAFAGKWNWVNQPKAFDKMVTELITAVDSAGEVPDLMHVGSSDIYTLYKNGTLQDLSEWAEAQAWFSDIDASAINACRGPDGALYCIPVAQLPQIVFVWKDRFPDGYPTTPEEFLTEAAALKEQGLYALTFFGSTDFDGEGMTRFIWIAMSSFGGTLDDGEGNMKLNTPENIAAIEFMRTLVTEGYAPEIAFAGGFQEEEAFKDASAASFPTGIFGYRYVNPLTAPNGTVYGKGNEEDMLDAIAAGDVYLAPFASVEGVEPGCHISVSSFAIPTGAAHPEAAQDYINWIMEPAQNPAWVIGPGGGFPVLGETQSAELFQTPFFQEAAKVVEESDCKPWYGTLERREEVKKLVMTTVYKLIKEDPTADIAEALQATDDEYNAGG